MESEAINIHDETGTLTKDLKLQAGNYLTFSMNVQSIQFLN